MKEVTYLYATIFHSYMDNNNIIGIMRTISCLKFKRSIAIATGMVTILFAATAAQAQGQQYESPNMHVRFTTNNYNNGEYSQTGQDRILKDIQCLETFGYWYTCDVVGWLIREGNVSTAKLYITGAEGEEPRKVILKPSQASTLPIGQFIRVEVKVRNENRDLFAMEFYPI